MSFGRLERLVRNLGLDSDEGFLIDVLQIKGSSGAERVLPPSTIRGLVDDQRLAG